MIYIYICKSLALILNKIRTLANEILYHGLVQPHDIYLKHMYVPPSTEEGYN